MAKADLPIDLLKAWEGSSGDNLDFIAKVIREGLDRITENTDGLFKRIQKGGTLNIHTKKWMEQYSYELRLTASLSSTTMTFSGYLLGAAITEGALRNHVKVGTVLKRPSDGLMVKVTAVSDYSTLTATVAAHGDHTLSNSTSAETWHIIGHISSDYDSTYVPKSIPRKFREVGTQILKEYLEIPYTQKGLKKEVIGKEAEHQLRELTQNFYDQIAMSCLHMEPVYSGGEYVYEYESETSAITGLLAWPKILQSERTSSNVRVDMDDSPVTVDVLNTLIKDMYMDEKADYNKKGWVIACDYTTYEYLSDEMSDTREMTMAENEIGYTVEMFRSKIGKRFEILADRNLIPGTLYVVNPSEAKWGYCENYDVMVERLGIDTSNVDKKKVTAKIWGVELPKPWTNIGELYNMPTTYTVSP